ncbi:MAG: pyridoxamine 5-phosphate oxidase [Ramlibacter sp.]|nr:pyridoxamine 5-phosphate oxidase [Ramlibacter sp.]
MISFGEVVRSEPDLRKILGAPIERSVRKEIARLDAHCRALISRSPFVLVASSNAAGRCDVSPKGDPPGFALVLDDQTLALPERPGNRRADTFANVLENPHVGLLFVIPGKLETLRVNGRAQIVRDAGLRERMCVAGKLPQLALVVSVEQVFIHCGKCMLRAALWNAETWPDAAALPSQAECLVDHAGLSESVAQVEESILRNRRTQLY